VGHGVDSPPLDELLVLPVSGTSHEVETAEVKLALDRPITSRKSGAGNDHPCSNLTRR